MDHFVIQVLAQIALFKEGFANKPENERAVCKGAAQELDEVAELMVRVLGTLTKLTRKQRIYVY